MVGESGCRSPDEAFNLCIQVTGYSECGRSAPKYLSSGDKSDRIPASQFTRNVNCYYYLVFNFGRPKTPGQWIVHIAGAIVALFLVCWMLWIYVL
jgi:hypothetical protein